MADLHKIFDIFSNYKCDNKDNVDEMFLEMMSDNDNFNNLMNLCVDIDDKKLIINEDMSDNIKANINRYGTTYKKIYECYYNCF